MTDAQIKRILEAFLLVTEKSLMVDQVREALAPLDRGLTGLGPNAQPADRGGTVPAAEEMPRRGRDAADIRRLLLELAQEYAQGERGLRIVEVAEGFQMVTDPALASHVVRLTRRVRTIRLTKPSLETLAIIAYRQPLTRIEIEQVRGVDAGGVLDTLLRLALIRITGRKEAPGRPLVYGTTREFLDHFGLRSLEDLPSREELQGVPAELKEVAGIAATESGAEIVQEAETTMEPSPTPSPQWGEGQGEGEI